MIIRIQDAKAVLFCSKGVRLFFKKYGLDYADFIKNGIDSDTLLEASSNDSMAKQVVEYAHGRV